MRRARATPAFFLPAVVILAAAASHPVHAQERGSLVGVVVDDSDDARLEGATVSVVEGRASATTDEDGRFLLPDVPAGSLALRVQAPGYTTVVERVEVSETDIAFFQVRLPRIAATLRELLVRGERSGAGGGESEITGNERDTRTAADLLADGVPGVEVLRGSGSVGTGAGIRIRGMSSVTQSNAPAIYLDGVRIDAGANRDAPAGRGQQVQHVLESIPAHEVLRIRVLRGPSAAARYADSANGVILVETRRGNEP